MTRRDGLLAAFVAAIWGINFVVSALMLEHLPPFLFTAVRFFFVAFPAIFFVGRPTSGWKPAVLMGILSAAAGAARPLRVQRFPVPASVPD